MPVKYETEEERKKRWARDKRLIDAEAKRTANEGESLEDSRRRWEQRDINAQRERDESPINKLKSAFEVGKESGYNPDASGEGDLVLLRESDSNNKRLTKLDEDGKAIRFNAKNQRDPNGEFYLYAKHKKAKTGLAQLTDKALGTNFSSWLDEGLIEFAGGALDLVPVTGGFATQIIGGDEYARNASKRMDELTDDRYQGVKRVSQIATDSVLVGVTSAFGSPVIGAGVAAGLSALRSTAAGINAEAHGYDFDWDGAAKNLGINIAASFVGGQAGGLLNGGKGIASGAVSGFAASGTGQLLNGEFDAEGLATGTILGGISGGSSEAGLAAKLIKVSYDLYRSGEKTKAQHEKDEAEILRKAEENSYNTSLKYRDTVIRSFGARAPSPETGIGINTSFTTDPF